jgi:hypothetical protein
VNWPNDASIGCKIPFDLVKLIEFRIHLRGGIRWVWKFIWVKWIKKRQISCFFYLNGLLKEVNLTSQHGFEHIFKNKLNTHQTTHQLRVTWHS